MPEVLRQNAPQVAHDSLRSAGLSLDEIALVRKLVGHTVAAVLAGWKSDPRRQRARHIDPRLAQQDSLVQTHGHRPV
jgi:hypothetical protein